MDMNKGMQQVWFDIPSDNLYFKERIKHYKLSPLSSGLSRSIRERGIVNQEGRRIDKG
jgi:hypothetical protein